MEQVIQLYSMQMQRVRRLLLKYACCMAWLCLASFLVSCDKLILTEGERIEVEIPLMSGKMDIRIDDVFDVELVKDSIRYIRVIGGENLVNQVYVHAGDTFLSIKNDATVRWLADYERLVLQLHIDTLNNLFLDKASSLSTTEPFPMAVFNLYAIADYHEVDIEVESHHFFFMTSHTTTGTFRFSGETKSMVLWPHYASRVDASNLKAGEALVINHSLGDISLCVQEVLRIANYRTVHYTVKGNPQVINRKDPAFDATLLPPEIRNDEPKTYTLKMSK